MNDPNKLQPLLKETVDNLKSRKEELEARILPIDQKLRQIAEQKARLADDWVKLNIDTTDYSELQRSLDQEETRLKSIRNDVDPAQIQELENTQGILRFWETQLQSMAWNTENEDGSMVRVVEKPHKTTLKIAGFEDKEASNILHFPATRRELLDMLQVRVVVFMDRIEVNAVFPIEPIDYQKYTSTRGIQGEDFNIQGGKRVKLDSRLSLPRTPIRGGNDSLKVIYLSGRMLFKNPGRLLYSRYSR